MSDSDPWRCEIDVHPPGWSFPAGKSWVAGWLQPSAPQLVTDVRAWIDGRPFLGLWGLPRPGVDERLLGRAGPPYHGFSFLLEPPAGATRLRLEFRDTAGTWHLFHTAAIRIAPDAAPAPARPGPAALWEKLLPGLLAEAGTAPAPALAAQAEDAVTAAISFPLNSLPNPPFHGALEEPRDDGWLRYGRLTITGWLTHRHHAIRRLSALLDPAQEVTLLHGLRREDVVLPEFADLPGRDCSAFLGLVDLPASANRPTLLKIFAELDNGEKHLVFAQRFAPQSASGTVAVPPPLPRRAFLRAGRALWQALRRHGLAGLGWADLSLAGRAVWSADRAEAPARRARPRRAALPDPATVGAGPLRVLVVTHNLNFEGAPWFIFELARYLSGQPGVSVRVVSPQEGPLRAVFAAAGLPVQVLDLSAALAATAPEDFHRALAAATAGLPWTETDLVIANTMVSFWAVLAARAAGKPALLYVHESASVRRFFARLLAPALLPLVEEAFRAATRVVFTADSTRAVHARLAGGDNFLLLPSWVEAGRIEAFAAAHPRDAVRHQHGLDPDAVLVVNIGSVCERKGQHTFIQAAGLLRDTLQAGPKVEFLMVGARPGYYLEMLRAEVARLGLEDRVRFLPETGAIFDFYRLADIFCCTSFEESFPRVLLESAVFGLPIVTTAVNGIPEMLREDEAWLIPPGDPRRLAEALQAALAAHLAGDRTRPEKARAAVLRKYHEARSLPLHAAVARQAAKLNMSRPH